MGSALASWLPGADPGSLSCSKHGYVPAETRYEVGACGEGERVMKGILTGCTDHNVCNQCLINEN